MIALRELGLPRQAYTVEAIDISHHALERAQQGLYGRHALRHLSESKLRLHFSPAGNGQLLHAEIRQQVQFQQANLLPFLESCTASYDVIFCRNVLIYLHAAARQAILTDLSRVLVPGGLLVVGSAEMPMVPEADFESLGEAFGFAFQRRDASGPRPQQRLAPPTSPSPREPLAESDPSAEALRRCQEQLKRDPAHAESYLVMAQLHQQAKHLQPALDCLRRCLYLDPDLEPALEALRDLNRQLGMEQQAQRLQERLDRRRRPGLKP